MMRARLISMKQLNFHKRSCYHTLTKTECNHHVHISFLHFQQSGHFNSASGSKAPVSQKLWPSLPVITQGFGCFPWAFASLAGDSHPLQTLHNPIASGLFKEFMKFESHVHLQHVAAFGMIKMLLHAQAGSKSNGLAFHSATLCLNC